MKTNIKSIVWFALAVTLATTISAYTTTIRPDGQGYYAAWTNVNCGSGTSEWQCVDEAVANTSDYLRSSTTAKETFAFGSTGLSGVNINSVTLNFYALQYKAADKCFSAMVRSGGSDYVSATQLCSNTTWSTYSQAYSTNPATGSAWTVAAVDALEAGFQGKDPNGGGSVAQVYAVVDYTFADNCSDTDGGWNLFTPGTVSGYDDAAPYSYSDSCANGTAVAEYLCSGSQWFTWNYDCTLYNGTSCVNGACV
jgi:hypothetical protein